MVERSIHGSGHDSGGSRHGGGTSDPAGHAGRTRFRRHLHHRGGHGGVSLLFPAVGEDGWFSVQPSGAFFWGFLTLAAVNLVVAVFAGIIATLVLVPARGWRWVTAGAALAVVGVGFYAAGVGGWAMLYYFAANSSQLDAPTATAFIESVNADGFRIFGAAAGGAGLIALAVVLMSIGLWRSGNVPKWLPVVAVIGSLITFVLPTDGPLGVLVEAPQAITGVVTGWLAWQFVRTSRTTLVSDSGHSP
jgi:hypothetical protein